jgi:hypothetical protein
MRLSPAYFVTLSTRSSEAKVGMARCAVPAAFSGGTFVPGATNPSLREAPVPRLHGAGTPQRGVPTTAFV